MTDKVYIGLEHAPVAFDLCSRVQGQGGANLDFIRSETGALVLLKGSAGDKFNPLHISLSHNRLEKLATARNLALSLVESIRQEFQQWSTAQSTPTNVPPPILNQFPPLVVPPPIVPAPPPAAVPVVNVQSQQPQMLQLVPQQQIYVAQDGTHYVKVSLAQAPVTNVGSMSSLPMGQGVNVVQQQQQVGPLPQPGYTFPHQTGYTVPPQAGYTVPPPPTVQILNGTVNTPAPTVCSAPILSTPSVAHTPMQAPNVQPWALTNQVATNVPTAPVNAAPNNNIPKWDTQPASQPNNNRPWNAPKIAQSVETDNTTPASNLPWYKNSQNVYTSPHIINKTNEATPKTVEVWTDGSGQNKEPAKTPVWETNAPVNPKAHMPDLLDEIKKDKDEESRPRESRRDRRSREQHRRRHPYSEVEYRKQFRSAGHMGDDRSDAKMPHKEEGYSGQRDYQQLSPKEPTADRQTQGQNPPREYQQPITGPPPTQTKWDQASQSPANASKWDRSPTNASPNKSQTYGQPQNYQQNYPNQYQNQYEPPPPPPPQSTPPAQNHEKQTPVTQYLSGPTTYTPPQNNSGWSGTPPQNNSSWGNQGNHGHQGFEQKPAWNQPQHPWNRTAQYQGQGNAGNQYAGPWNNSLPQPPAFGNQPNFW